MYYVNQTNYPHVPYPTMTGMPELARTDTTIRDSGCGVCCASMVATNLTGTEFSLADSMELAISVGANHSPGTDMSLLAPYLAERFDLDLVVTMDADTVRDRLARGYMAIANVGGDRPEDGYVGLFSHGGHFVAVVGIDQGDDTVTVLDPSQLPDKFHEPGRQGRVVENGIYLHCPLDALLEDCVSRKTEDYPDGEFRSWLAANGKRDAENRVYLFGRK